MMSHSFSVIRKTTAFFGSRNSKQQGDQFDAFSFPISSFVPNRKMFADSCLKSLFALFAILFFGIGNTKAQTNQCNITISATATSGGSFTGTAPNRVFTPTASTANILASALVTELLTNNVTINTAFVGGTGAGNVSFNSTVTAASTSATQNTFTVTAGGAISLASAVTINLTPATTANNTAGNPSSNIIFTAVNNITIPATSTITTNGGASGGGNTGGGGAAGGSISLTSTTGSINVAAALSTIGSAGTKNGDAGGNGGNISLLANAGGVSVSASLTTTSGAPGAGGVAGVAGNVTLTNATTTTTIAGANDGQSAGVIGAGTGNFTKSGLGTVLLSGANTYTGTTTITAGNLTLGAAERIANTSNMILNGGTFQTGATAGFTETLGTLALTANSTIALGTGVHSITFANSSAVAWTAGRTLTINGWTGTGGVTGTAGKIFVGAAAATLTATQLAQISFTGYGGTPILLATGELVPVAAVITTAGALSAVTTPYGTPSSFTSFTVSGTNLSTGITLTAPAGFEISQIAGGAGAYASTQTITPTGSTIASTTIYVRLAATSVVGSYTGNVTCTSTGAVTRTVATVSSTVTKAVLSITAANQSVLYGTAATTVTSAGTYTPSGFKNGETASVIGGTASYITNYTATTFSGTAGVTITPVTTSLTATNYSFSAVNGLITITPLDIATADFRTRASGNFSSTSTWQFDQGGNNWANATQAPTGNNNITILNTHTVALDQNHSQAASKTLLINTGGSLVVNPNITLGMASTGTINLNGQLVTIKSDITGSGAIGQVLGTLSGASNVTVERYIPNNGFRSWRLLSIPTFGTQTINQSWQEGNTPMANNTLGFGTLINGTTTSLGFDSVSTYPSMLTFNGTNFVGIPRTSIPISTNKAYFVYVRGDRSQTGSASTSSTTSTTLRTNGALYQGTQTSALIPASSYALIGNPFASPINFSSITRAGGVNNIFYIWDSKIQSGSTLGSYQTFSATNNFNCLISGGSFTLAAPNTTIQSGQAFFVETSGTSGTVSIPESSKVSSNGNAGYKLNGELVKIDSRLYSVNEDGTSTMADANVVVFDSAYANAIDGDDASKFSNTGENLGVLRNSETLVVEGRQPVNSADTIFFRMWNMQPHNYQLEFVPQNLGAQNLVARLEDSYLNTSTTIDLNANTVVNFNVNAAAASYASNRFRIVFTPSFVLPVNFISVDASRKANNVQVNWKIANEISIRQYDIERSIDGSKFDKVGTVSASAASLYNFTDVNAPVSTVFYRIKSIGVGGDQKYSAVVKVSSGNVKQGFAVVPNPVEGAVMNIQFNNQAKGKYQLSLLNNDGQQMMSTSIYHTGGSSTQMVALPAGIAKGYYQLNIVSPDKKSDSQTVLVNNNF